MFAAKMGNFYAYNSIQMSGLILDYTIVCCIYTEWGACYIKLTRGACYTNLGNQFMSWIKCRLSSVQIVSKLTEVGMWKLAVFLYRKEKRNPIFTPIVLIYLLVVYLVF